MSIYAYIVCLSRSAVGSVCSRSMIFKKCWFLMQKHVQFCSSSIYIYIYSYCKKKSFIVQHTHTHFSLPVCTTPFKTVECTHPLKAQYAFQIVFLQAIAALRINLITFTTKSDQIQALSPYPMREALRNPTQRGGRCFGPQRISGAQGDGCRPHNGSGASMGL